MWAASHTLLGVIFSEALKEEKSYVKYPLLLFCGYLTHRYLDSIPFVWKYHIIESFDIPFRGLIIGINVLVILVLFLFEWRRTLEGMIFFWLLEDFEHIFHYFNLTSIYLFHYRPIFFISFPYDNLVAELVFVVTLGIVALRPKRIFSKACKLSRIIGSFIEKLKK